MKIVKLIFKVLFIILSIPVLYLVVSLILSSFTVNDKQEPSEEKVYLVSNGLHLDIVIPSHLLSENLKRDLVFDANDHYFAFGWGDENFYLQTPQWKDLTAKNAFSAMFLKSSSLMHLRRHASLDSNWIPVPLDSTQIVGLSEAISNSFVGSDSSSKVILTGKGYGAKDDFYKAIGSYSVLKTCNSWTNTTFKRSGMRACYWTPFDFGLINKYVE
jgi:uncharacterized protein (TIGR02117 family)